MRDMGGDVTGFPNRVRDVIAEREGGRCARCGTSILSGGHMHHRRPRQRGGTKSSTTNGPANGLHLCPGCHDWIESNREAARRDGWLLYQNQDPAQVPVAYRGSYWTGQAVRLNEDGTVTPHPQLDGRMVTIHEHVTEGRIAHIRDVCMRARLRDYDPHRPQVL